MDEEKDVVTEVEMPEVAEGTTILPGLTATMEIAGVESIPNVDPGTIVLGFARD